MLQSYDDITDFMSRIIRRDHYHYMLYRDCGHEGVHRDCKSFSYDLLGTPDRISPDGLRCCRCVARPAWWDENGVPRFAPHHPSLAPDIYANEVALLLIACQACLQPFRVQMSWSRSGAVLGQAKTIAAIERSVGIKVNVSNVAVVSLAQQVRDFTVHYGDPPHHECATGVTMNCHDVRVVEFWKRDTSTPGWVRAPELEIQLPDANEIEGSIITGGDAP